MCSCGKKEKHVIATRRTYDGTKVQLWSDGVVTYGLLAFGFKGIGTPRTQKGRETYLRVGWDLMKIVELYPLKEVAGVWKQLKEGK